MADTYERLAVFLDELPAGFPRTESGVELRILHKLFSPEQAELVLHLSLVPEPARVVAFRARQPLEQVTAMLEEMEQKGLISGNHKPGRPAEFAAAHFAIGFYEEQVNHLDQELVELVGEYLPAFIEQGAWELVPQLRTIPVGESIAVQAGVMPYERAEEIVRAHTTFAVRNCVCRQGQQLTGKDCGKPLETCLSFAGAAHQTVYTGRGRFITLDETLAILKQAEETGLVLQPSNSKNPIIICACCGCCCGVLLNLKRHPKPASLVANPFIAQHDPEICTSCGACIERCQMEALTQAKGSTTFHPDRCIGCGLCTSTCPTGAVTLARKPISEQPDIPKNTLDTYLRLGKKRGKLGTGDLIGVVARSKIHRFIAPR